MKYYSLAAFFTLFIGSGSAYASEVQAICQNPIWGSWGTKHQVIITSGTGLSWQEVAMAESEAECKAYEQRLNAALNNVTLSEMSQAIKAGEVNCRRDADGTIRLYLDYFKTPRILITFFGTDDSQREKKCSVALDAMKKTYN